LLENLVRVPIAGASMLLKVRSQTLKLLLCATNTLIFVH
jgi:hypothetical protein